MRWTVKERTRKPGWFAWYPVYLEDTKKWAWFERVERILHESGSSADTYDFYHTYQELPRNDRFMGDTL